MLEETFNDLADLALRRSGQVIAPSKTYLMEARLAPIARREGFGSLDDLAHCLRARPNPVFEVEVAAALTSKTTRFMSDGDTLASIVSDVLPKRLKETSNGRMRIWCAGGATGQEAYSMAMLLADDAPASLTGARIDIVSTDLCKNAVERARDGAYGHFEVQRGLSIHRLLRHFEREETGQWRISNALRSAVSFREQNLIEDTSGLGRFDVILCRNVLPGMAKSLRKAVTERFAHQLNPGGIVVLGQGEALGPDCDQLEQSPNAQGAYVSAGTAEREAAA